MSRSDGGVEKTRLCLFILLNSEKNEPRSSGSYRAIRLVATVAVGVCGTRSARTVLALFPPSLLRLRRPIKAESGDLACILTPSPCGHSPYILRCKTQGRRVNSITSIAGLFNPSPSDLPYILRYKTQGEEGSTGFENEVGYRSFFFAVL